VIGRIYDAALDPRLWPEVVGEIGRAEGSEKALLLTSLHAPSQGGFAFPVGISESTMQQWADRYVQHDAWSKAIVEKKLYVEGRVMTDQEFLPHEELLQSFWYKDFLSRIGIARVCTGIVFGMESRGVLPTAMSVFRDAKDRAFGDRECSIHRMLVPHLSRALGIMFRLRDAELKVAATLASLDRLTSGVVLIGGKRAVLFANRAARAALQEEDGVRLVVNAIGKTYLAAASPDAQRMLEAALDLSLTPDAVDVPHFSQALRVERPSGRAAYALNVSALPIQNEFGSGTECPRAIAFLTDPAEPVQVDEQILHRLYGLTHAECRLAEAVCAGESLPAVAARLGVSENTAKTQLQSVFDKTGTHRQAQLVKLILSLSSTAR
jgi:DNA-binding CsgD family transcriptional regulator